MDGTDTAYAPGGASIPDSSDRRTLRVILLSVAAALLALICLVAMCWLAWVIIDPFPTRKDYSAARDDSIPPAAMIANGYGFSVAVAKDGSLLAWRAPVASTNSSGPLESLYTSAPVTVGSGPGWLSVGAGEYHALALRSDGALWAWGGNDRGQLGDGTTIGRTTPVRIGTGAGWSGAYGGAAHSVALRSDGTLWSWGSNENGQLGQKDTSGTTAPTQVGSDADWAGVAATTVGTLAVKKDGTLWACGTDPGGLYLAGPEADAMVLTRIGTESDWASVVEAFAIKQDGSLWVFPYVEGRYGGPAKVGLPERIGEETGFKTASSGAGPQYVAVKDDGTLWAWGLMDSVFELTGSRVPIKVGTDTDWVTAVADPGTT